jgi:hypothetical protein
MKPVVLLVACGLAIGGCSTSPTSPLIPSKSIYLTATNSISLSTVVTALAVVGAIYLVYDPLAPNWEIEESRLNDDTYRFSMKMKRYHTGGSGESLQILKRRASQLQYEQGFAEYHIMEYTEGIDSHTIGARRVAEGTIKLVQREQADSFRLNDRY